MITVWVTVIVLSSERPVLKCIKLSFQDSYCKYFSFFGLHCEPFFRKRQEIITLQQNRRAATYHKGSLGFLYVHNNGKFLFLGWHSCASWRRGGEVTLTPHIHTPNKISWKLAIPFMRCISHDHNLPHIDIPLFWPALALQGLCHVRGLTWLWGVSGHLWKPLSSCLWKERMEDWGRKKLWLKAKVRVWFLVVEIINCVSLLQSDLQISFWIKQSNRDYQ